MHSACFVDSFFRQPALIISLTLSQATLFVRACSSPGLFPLLQTTTLNSPKQSINSFQSACKVPKQLLSQVLMSARVSLFTVFLSSSFPRDWLAIHSAQAPTRGEIRSVRNGEKIPAHWKSDLLPIYTRTSRSDPTNQGNTEDKRWSSEGIIRFNALRLLVIKDRADHPDFKIPWFNQVREQMKGTLDTNVDDLEDSGHVDADDDLFPETAAAQPVLNPVKQKLGAHSDSDDSSEGN
jgi:hypothetical protein